MMDALEEIRARVEAAAEGPWEWEGGDVVQCGGKWGAVVENTVICGSYCYGGSVDQEVKTEDREFIAHARTDVPRLLTALDAVLELHRLERRWMPFEGADVSLSTAEEAATYSSDGDASTVVPLDLCTHCKQVEESPCEGECTQELGYLACLWPCPTVAAITAALEGER
jgi:hypothetical protein